MVTLLGQETRKNSELNNNYKLAEKVKASGPAQPFTDTHAFSHNDPALNAISYIPAD